MIKIFRKIRQNLLIENKTRKYFKYAVGEIVLVVIGILIALSINNWNEERKLTSVEIKILKDLKNDIHENIGNLNEGINYLKIANNDITKVLLMYEQKATYNDSLLPAFSNFFGQWDPDFTYAGFENLKNIGVNIISNTTLRTEIINLIEVEMDILDNSDVRRIDQLNLVMVLPIMKKYFSRDLNNKDEYLPLIPSNYQTMINDQEFYNVCTEIAYRQKRSIIRFSNFNKKANKLISKIESEIQLIK